VGCGIYNDQENELITWRSLPGSLVKNSGEVIFKEAPGNRGTEVRVQLVYDPPAGSAGAAFARLFGEEPDQQIAEDLRRLKQIMETGEAPTVAGQTSGRIEQTLREREQIKKDRGKDRCRSHRKNRFQQAIHPAFTSGVKEERA
jgi:hypothetical protein